MAASIVKFQGVAASCDFLRESLSKQNILVVGDGNFSFSLSLADYAVYSGSKTPLVLTSFDGSEKLLEDEIARENLNKLSSMENVDIMHGVDATNLSQWFPARKFGRIIFNFPHTGGKSNIKKSRKLLEDFFNSATQHLHCSGGDICVTLCKGQGGTPHDQVHRSHGNSWQIVDNAAKAGLILHQLLPFVSSDYCYYKSVGYRSRLKQSFHTSEALIHVFIPGIKVDSVEDLREKDPQVVMDYILKEIGQLKSKVVEYDNTHPIHFIKEEIFNKLKTIKDKLGIPHFRIIDPNVSFIDADFVTHDFHRTTDYVKHACVRNGSLPNQNILSAFMEHGSFVQTCTFLTIPELVSPTSSITSNNLIIGRLFEDSTNCHFSQADSEIQAVMRCLMTLLPDDKDYDLLQQNFLMNIKKEDVSVLSRWVNSSEVAHLARRKCYLNCKNNENVSSPLQSNVVCKCCDLQEKYLRKDSRINLEQLVFSELVLLHTLQMFKTSSHTTVFQCGHVDPDVLEELGMTNNKYGWLINVNLDALALLRYSIRDIRDFWSSTVRMELLNPVTNEMGDLVEVPRFVSRPISLFPPSYIHDISFWVSDDVSQQQFTLVLITLTHNCVKEVKLNEIYHDENKHWLSFNYRMVYSRVDGPLSHLEAVQFQNNLRRALIALNFGLK